MELGEFDLFDLSARCVTQQAFTEEASENGMAMLLLVFFRLVLQRERFGRLQDPTREQLDRCLLSKTDHENHFQAFNIAKSVARFSFGLTKKDDTGKVIDRFVERIEANSSAGFRNDDPEVPAGLLISMAFFLHFYQASTAITRKCSFEGP